MAAKNNQLIIEFAAQLDSSIKTSFNQISSVVDRLTAQVALLSDNINRMNGRNRDVAGTAKRMRTALNEVTSSVVKHTTAVSKGRAVSDSYLKTQQQIEKQYDLTSAAAGTALRALEKTERQYQRNVAAINSQKTALAQLIAQQKKLAADYRDAPTVGTKLDAYDALRRNAAAIQTARNTLMTSITGLNASFNYAKTYADNLARIQQAMNGASLATKMFGKEQQWVANLARQITSRTGEGTVEQRRQFTLLRQYVREVGSEYQKLASQIKAAETAALTANANEQQAIRRTIAALQARQQSLVVGASTGGIGAFDSWARGITRVEAQYRSLNTVFESVRKAAERVTTAARQGLISASEAQKQLRQLAAASSSAAGIQRTTGISTTQMNSIIQATGVLNQLTEGRVSSLREVNRQLETEARRLRETVPLHQRIATEIGNTVRTLAQYAVAGSLVYGVASSFGAAGRAIVEYDQSMKDLQAITGATQLELEALGNEIRKVAVETRYGMTEVAAGAKVIGQAGYDASQTIQVLGATMKLAQGTISDVSSTADLLTTVLMSFRQTAGDAAGTADVMAAAINRSKLDVEKLRTVFNYIGPVAMDAGISMQEATSALMLLANNGMKASTIGTSLRNLFSQLASPSAKLKKYFDGNAEALKRLTSDTTPLIERFKILNQVIGTNTNLYPLFGLRAAGAASLLINLSGTLEELQDSLYVMGTAAVMADTQMEGLGNRLENLRAAAEVFAVSTTTTAASIFSELVLGLQKAISFLTEFADGAVGNAITTVTLLTGAIAALVTAVKVLGTWITWLAGGSILGGIATRLGGLAVGVTALSGAMGGATLASKAMGVALGGLGTALTFLAAHPVVAAILALGAAVTMTTAAIIGMKDETKAADAEVAKLIEHMSQQRDVLSRALTANENVSSESSRRQAVLYAASAVPDVAEALLANIGDREEVSRILKDELTRIGDDTVITITEQANRVRDRIEALKKERDASLEAISISKNAAGRIDEDGWFTSLLGDKEGQQQYAAEQAQAVVREQQQRQKAIQEAEKQYAGLYSRLEIMARKAAQEEVAARGDAINVVDSYTNALNRLTQALGNGEAVQRMRTASIEVFRLENNKAIESVKSLNDYIKESAGVDSVEKQAEAYGDLADVVLPRLQKAAQEYYASDLKAQKQFADNAEALDNQMLVNKNTYYDKLKKVAEQTLKEEMEFAKLEAEYKKSAVAEALDAGKISTEEAAKQRAQIDREAAEASISLIQQMMAYVLNLNKLEIEKKQLNIELILSGAIDAETMRLLQGAMPAGDFAFFSGLASQLASASKSKNTAITAANRPTAGASRANRDRIAALKAELDAEQALNEKAYQLGEITYEEYTDARIASEKRLLEEREKVAMSMSGAERERALQELAKDRAEFELEMIKEQQAARAEAADRQIELDAVMYEQRMELARQAGMTEEAYAIKQAELTLATSQQELALIEEKLTWKNNEIEKEELTIEMYAKKAEVLKNERALQEARYEAAAKYMDEEYRLGMMTTEQYKELVRIGVQLGKISPLEGLERIQLASGPMDAFAAGLRSAKENAASFNEELANFAITLADRINTLSDDFVDSWYEGTKSTRQLLNDFINDIQRDFQKSFMRGLLNTALYGAPGSGDGTSGMGGGVFGLLTGGYGMGGATSVAGRGQAPQGAATDVAYGSTGGQATTSSEQSGNATAEAAKVTQVSMEQMQTSTESANNESKNASKESVIASKQMVSAVTAAGIGIMGIASGTKEGMISGIMMLTTAALQIFSMMAAQTAASSSASSAGGIFGAIASIFAAKGAVVGGGTISSYSNSIVTKPTPFLFSQKFAKGGVGLMGEVPGKAEAILPLTQSSNGRYGVDAHGIGGGEQHITINIMDSDGRTRESFNVTNNQGQPDFVATFKKAVQKDIGTYGTGINRALRRQGLRTPVMKNGA